jgi:acetyltransferase-like isoleucine patch superfamily enzyme
MRKGINMANNIKKDIKLFLKDVKKGQNKKRVIEFKIEDGKVRHPKNMFLCYLRKMCFIVLGKIPPSRIKNNITRLLGVKLGKDVCLPMDVIFDHIYPELINVKKDTIVGGYSQLWAQEFKDDVLRIGKVDVGKEALICGACTVAPGADIGDGALIGGWSYMDGKAKNYEFWGGKPCKFLKKLPEDWNYIDRSNPRKYYKESRKAIKEYISDPKRTETFHVMYKGARGNAGCDWYLVRSTTRIWLTAAWIEFCNFFPACGFKNFLLRFTGVKIGKGVKIPIGGRFDHIYPELIILGDNVVIEKMAYVGSHDFTNNRSTVGRISIGKNTVVGSGSAVQAGISVGEDVIIEPQTFVNKDVPSKACIGGIPGKIKNPEEVKTSL